MVIWGLLCAAGWAAPSWSEMVADAETIRPSLAVPATFERPTGAAAVDLIAPLGASWLVVGTTALSPQGMPREGAIELWNTKTGATQWTIPRPPVPGAIWEVLETTPLVIAGRAKGKLILIGMDIDLGTVHWTVEANHPLLERDGETALIWRNDHLESIGLQDGKTVWKVPTGKPDRLRMGIGRVVVETAYDVVAIESGWGTESWRVTGRWRAAPPTDPTAQVLYQPNVVQVLDPYGQPTWTWSPDHPVVAAHSEQGRAVVVTREPEADRISIVANGDALGSFKLKGRQAAPLTPLNGVLVVTTDTEIVAFSPTDGAIGFRKSLPDSLLPRAKDADADQLVLYDDRLVVIRPDRGVAGFEAANFSAGELIFEQPFVAPGTDGRSLVARRTAERGTSDNTRLRRVHERLAAQRWLEDPIQGDHLIRPFRTGRVQGFTLVNLFDGRRADVVTGPVWPGLQGAAMDPMVAALDRRGETFLVADVPVDPSQWLRIELGDDLAMPAPAVRGIPMARLAFGAEPNPLIGLGARPRPETTPVEAAPVGSSPPAESTLDIDQLFFDNGGPSWPLCVREGIVQAARPAVVQACLRTGVRLQDPNAQGMHALLLAADRNQLETVRLLLDAGANPNTAGAIDARTAFERATDLEVKGLIAARGGRERSKGAKKKAMKELLGLAGLKKPNDGWCFHHVTQGRLDVLDYCLERGRLLTYVDSGQGHVLHVAADRGWTEHIRRLLQAGANPNVVDSTGVTPRGRLDAIGALNPGQQAAASLLESSGGM
ncbi:MAG: hypothetical protein AAGA48_19885 [Myxococcota bacterium]